MSTPNIVDQIYLLYISYEGPNIGNQNSRK